MSKVRVHPTDDIEWVTLRSLYPEHLAVKHSVASNANRVPASAQMA